MAHFYKKTNKCEKCPFSIWCWDSNSRPLEHESLPITTWPGLPPIQYSYTRLKFVYCIASVAIPNKAINLNSFNLTDKWKIKMDASHKPKFQFVNFGIFQIIFSTFWRVRSSWRCQCLSVTEREKLCWKEREWEWSSVCGQERVILGERERESCRDSLCLVLGIKK